MTTNPVTANASSFTPTAGQGLASTATPGSSLGQDAFLKLLVAQLKYQDPMNPADGADFMAQTAQFTMVEKLAELQKQGDQSIASQQNMQAISMVGKTVTYEDASGAIKQGVVDSVRFSGGGQTLVINGTSVNLSNIGEVVRDKTPSVSDSSATLRATIEAAILSGMRTALSDLQSPSATTNTAGGS